MAGDLDSAQEDEREVELSSIAAIFPELSVDPANSFAASIDLPVTPTTPLLVRFLPSDTVSAAGQDTAASGKGAAEPPLARASTDEPKTPDDIHHLAHLPPLSLQILLPDGYPESRSPLFTLSTASDWLPVATLEALQQDGKRLWEELGRAQVVFSYIDHLQQAAESAFNLAQAATGFPLDMSADLKLALLGCDAKIRREHFERETFNCGVCLDPKRGSSCYRLNICSHVFCLQCLQDFYRNCITEGDVASVKCLDPGCGKDKSTIPQPVPTGDRDQRTRRRKRDPTLGPNELLQIGISGETVKRYVDLKRKAKLEADRNTIYCPRKWCQGAARSKRHPMSADDAEDEADDESEAEVEDEPRSWKDGDSEATMPAPTDRVAICEDCSYAFCRVCRAGWHGELTRCWPRKPGELTAEEQATAEYMQKYSSPCPTCSAPCQKTMGCNHMICFKCKTHFCYLCGSWLDAGNPYHHFNQPLRGCFMRLWEMEAGDGLDPRREGGGGMHDDFNAVAMRREAEDWGAREQEVAELREDIEVHQRHVREIGQAMVRQRMDLERVQRALAAANHPAPVPAPPGGNGRGQEPRNGGNRGARRHGPGGRGGRPDEPAARGAEAGRERVHDVQQQGLQRFLRMVELDEEDEWDSDELMEEDGVFGDWEIPV